MLIDAGLEWGLDARRAHIQVSNAVTDLNILGVQRKKITHVILTHLHYDHAAGLSFTGEHGRVRPTLPNAQIILPREEWNFALQQTQKHPEDFPLYRIDDLYRLYADNFFIFLTSAEQELFRNCTSFGQVEIRRGHQVAVIRDGGANACFLGDLVSEQNQLNEFGKKHAHTHWLEVKK